MWSACHNVISLPNLSLTVKHKWRSTTLKSQSSDRTRKCSQCWCVIAAKDRVQCQKCGAYKHMHCSKSVCGICIFCETQCSTAEGKELCSIVGGYTGGAIEVASEECHQGKHQAANDKGKVPKGENICSKSTSNSEIGRLTVRDEGTQTEDNAKEAEVYGTSLSTDNAAAADVVGSMQIQNSKLIQKELVQFTECMVAYLYQAQKRKPTQ
ncbi:uncharacterized protein LOC113019331 isoform X3 [Astatotilapia calliptera]|uniref:uncharacterized protein LOC113019331 isoform X3 n=1 Tax=Astatotilapia calliptera TaxID=8154 RepID=UPI000E3FD2FC|nr:uncharacterized protein LOC113019331 isoform X3 [Astatotilapia calliptera]